MKRYGHSNRSEPRISQITRIKSFAIEKKRNTEKRFRQDYRDYDRCCFFKQPISPTAKSPF